PFASAPRSWPHRSVHLPFIHRCALLAPIAPTRKPRRGRGSDVRDSPSWQAAWISALAALLVAPLLLVPGQPRAGDFQLQGTRDLLAALVQLAVIHELEEVLHQLLGIRRA